MKQGTINTLKTGNEKTLREFKFDESIKSIKSLKEVVDALANREHDYGTCCYAMSLSAYAAFKFIAHRLGVTGFQASIADMEFIRLTRMYPGPFTIINGEDALYPQYNLPARLEETLAKWRPWLREQARKKLATDRDHAHPDVVAHWERLACDGDTHLFDPPAGKPGTVKLSDMDPKQRCYCGKTTWDREVEPGERKPNTRIHVSVGE